MPNLVNMGLPKINSVKLAKYLLAIGGPMSHLKLQKLIYYVEGCHLAILEEPLITDEFEAWMHGPVAPKVWHHFKNQQSPLYDSLSLDKEESTKIIGQVRGELTADQIDLIADVWNELGEISGYRLECMTHSELPWIEARGDTPPDAACSSKISKQTMKAHFTKELYGASGKAKAA